MIDAGGARSSFTARESGGTGTYQTAYGLVARLSSWPSRDLTWMDFRDDHLDVAERALPTFLYALPWPDGRVLVEETALVRSPRCPSRRSRRACVDGSRITACASSPSSPSSVA
ncbi:MAG: lycopene cyclase family protein [Polyangiales bacterium]